MFENPRIRSIGDGVASYSRRMDPPRSEPSLIRQVARVPEERLETNVACPGCGCVCDDLTVRLAGNALVGVEPNCALAEAWFLGYSATDRPAAEIQGRPAPMADAARWAAQILRDADYPLIYGLSRSATSGQRAAVDLAERTGAVIDTTASLCHGPSIMAIQEFGECTCTLGEVRNRADLVVFWGCNPGSTHPRHAERYSVFPLGRYRGAGRTDRIVAMVGPANQVDDWRLDPHGARPDLVIPIEPGRDFEAIAMLRAMLRGDAVPEMPVALQTLCNMLKNCRTGVVFFGLGLVETQMWAQESRPTAGNVNVGALLQLVAELNTHARFFARRMRLQGDVSGADNVLTWQTGYPFAVNLSRSYPRYNPGEFSASDLLDRGEPDACLLVGAETVPYFSPAALRHLQSIPKIVLDYPGAPRTIDAEVSFTTAVYGLHAAGTIYRMDNVPVPLRKLADSEYPTDEQVLRAICERL